MQCSVVQCSDQSWRYSLGPQGGITAPPAQSWDITLRDIYSLQDRRTSLSEHHFHDITLRTWLSEHRFQDITLTLRDIYSLNNCRTSLWDRCQPIDPRSHPRWPIVWIFNRLPTLSANQSELAVRIQKNVSGKKKTSAKEIDGWKCLFCSNLL